MKHTWVVSTKCTPGFACRAFSDTTLVEWCQLNALQASPVVHLVTPLSCVSLSMNTQPSVPAINTGRVRFTVILHTLMRSRFYHTQIMYKRNWDCSCLVNLIYFAQHIFQIHNLLHCVDESWWNMPFKETRLCDGVADDAVAKLLPLWLHAAALWRHAVWILIVTSHNAWMGYEYSLTKLNRPRAIHKHNPHHLETMGRVW